MMQLIQLNFEVLHIFRKVEKIFVVFFAEAVITNYFKLFQENLLLKICES